jgi:hypothetical protein
MDFREWPPRRIFLLSVGWVFAILALFVWLVSRMSSAAGDELGGGVGAVSFGLFESAALLFGPPLLLWCLWLALRRRSEG